MKQAVSPSIWTSRPHWLQRLWPAQHAAAAPEDDPASLGTAFGLDMSLMREDSLYDTPQSTRSARPVGQPHWPAPQFARRHR